MTDQQVNLLTDTLLGTTKDLESTLEELEIDATVDEAIDEIADTIDECSGCGWWYELCELHGDHDFLCDDCDPDWEED